MDMKQESIEPKKALPSKWEKKKEEEDKDEDDEVKEKIEE